MRKIVSMLLTFMLFVSGCEQEKPVTESIPVERNELLQESSSAPHTVNVFADNSLSAGSDGSQKGEVDETEKNITEDFDLSSYRQYEPDYPRLNDPDLLRYVEDNIYAELVASLDSDKYFVQNINAIYLSKEYIEELEYNSLENIFLDILYLS